MSSDLIRQQQLQSRCGHRLGEHWEISRAEVESTLSARFERVAAKFSEHIAIQDRHDVLTYGELDAAANRLAHQILDERGRAEEPVGVLAGPGADAVVALLAILKAGKFFVPLDPLS